MSTNCVRCVRNPRNGNNPTSLLCLECESKEWDKQCQMALTRYPSFASFVNTWGSHCGAPKDTFTGHALRLIVDVIKETEGMLDPKAPGSNKTVSDLMHALVDNIEEDILLALRFAYYVRAKPLIPDPMYDEAEKEYINRPEVDDTPLMQPGSDKEADYPARIRALYTYLGLARMDQSTGEAPSAALRAKSSTVKATAKAKTAKPEPEAATGSLF